MPFGPYLGRAAGAQVQLKIRPPLTLIICPVTNAASSLVS